MAAPTLRLSVDWVHIREAERKAAGVGTRRTAVSPVLLAIREQTRFTNATFTPNAVVLIDEPTEKRVRYADSPALRAYVVAWAAGQAVAPATFTLELPGA
jgi:hypothetical protein